MQKSIEARIGNIFHVFNNNHEGLIDMLVKQTASYLGLDKSQLNFMVTNTLKKLNPLVEVFKKSMDSYSEAIVIYFVRCVLPILKKINDMGL